MDDEKENEVRMKLGLAFLLIVGICIGIAIHVPPEPIRVVVSFSGQDACIYASMEIPNKTWTVETVDIRERIRCNKCHEDK